MTLYEINEAIRNFKWEVDEETGEILNVDELDKLNLAKEEKIEAIGILIKECKAEGEAIKAEIANLTARLKRNVKRMESLLDYMRYALQGESFKTARVQATFRRSQKVEILDENVIPDEFMKIETKRTPVKDLIKKAIKSGKEVKGAELVENSTLTVK